MIKLATIFGFPIYIDTDNKEIAAQAEKTLTEMSKAATRAPIDYKLAKELGIETLTFIK